VDESMVVVLISVPDTVAVVEPIVAAAVSVTADVAAGVSVIADVAAGVSVTAMVAAAAVSVTIAVPASAAVSVTADVEIPGTIPGTTVSVPAPVVAADEQAAKSNVATKRTLLITLNLTRDVFNAFIVLFSLIGKRSVGMSKFGSSRCFYLESCLS
jgi:hypothetical protein